VRIINNNEKKKAGRKCLGLPVTSYSPEKLRNVLTFDFKGNSLLGFHSPVACVPTASLVLPNIHSCFYNLENAFLNGDRPYMFICLFTGIWRFVYRNELERKQKYNGSLRRTGQVRITGLFHQSVVSPYNVNTFTNRCVMRIKKNHQQPDIVLMYLQILRSKIKRNVWYSVGRIRFWV